MTHSFPTRRSADLFDIFAPPDLCSCECGILVAKLADLLIGGAQAGGVAGGFRHRDDGSKARCRLPDILDDVVPRLDERSLSVFYDPDRKSTRLNSSHSCAPRMPSSA